MAKMNQKTVKPRKEIEEVASETSTVKRGNGDGIKFGRRGAPTLAEKKLIEMYKANNPNDVVPNTLDKLIIQELPFIKEMISNLEKFSDPNTFKLLPRELDGKIRDYSLIITEYYGRKRKDWANVPMYVVPESYKRCGKCATYKNRDEFYKSFSDCCDGNAHICKDCCNELFVKYFKQTRDIKESLIMISQKIDMFVYEPIIKKFVNYYETEGGKTDFYKRTFLGSYMGDVIVHLNLVQLQDAVDFTRSNFNGVPFKLANKVESPPIYDDKFLVEESMDEEDMVVSKNIEKLRAKWGVSNPEDLKLLEDRWSEYESEYDISSVSTRSVVRQLCLEELYIMQKRMAGDNPKDAVATFLKLQSSQDLTPKSKTTAEGNVASFSKFSDLVLYAEHSKPIINKNPKFEDVDSFNKLRDNIVGALSQTLLKENEYVAKMKENFKDSVIDIGVPEGS